MSEVLSPTRIDIPKFFNTEYTFYTGTVKHDRFAVNSDRSVDFIAPRSNRSRLLGGLDNPSLERDVGELEIFSSYQKAWFTRPPACITDNMPPPSNSPALHLKVLKKPFRIFKLEPQAAFPLALLGVMQKPSTDEFMSITRNAEEVSVVTDHEFFKSDELNICEEGKPWRCIKVQGPMEHNLTGIMAALTAPLRDAQVPIFAISTWDTDWLL
ncbi:hypothetical protein FRC12_022441, partial [Ceratobasidium sp. 428]